MLKTKEEKRMKAIKQSVHQELVKQVIGLLGIEIGNALDELGIFYKTIEAGGGIDMFIDDDDFEESGYFGPMTHLVHLHPEDLIWAILNIQEIKARALKQVDKYINYRKELYK